MTTRVVHGSGYVNAHDVGRRIKELPEICLLQPYLECVVNYYEITTLCKKFAVALDDETLQDVDVFLASVESESSSAS